MSLSMDAPCVPANSPPNYMVSHRRCFRWKALTDRGLSPQDLVQFAKSKLIKGARVNSDTQALVLFAQRLCLNLVPGHLESARFVEDTVEGHMCYLLSTSDDRRYLYTFYPVEPLLSHCAAELFWEGPLHYINVLSSKVRAGMVEKSAIGEMVGRLLCILAKDVCCQELSPREHELRYCGAVGLLDFLQELFGKPILHSCDDEDRSRIQKLFGSALVSFSYWVHMREKIES